MRATPLLVAALLGGCAYTFNTSLPGHIETVQVPVFDNRTLEVVLAEELTTSVTDRFVRRNELEVVQRDGDSVLEGRITGYEEKVFGFSAEQRADEYVVIITASMTFRDRVRGKEIWKQEEIRGVGSYFVGSSQAGVATTVEEARQEAIRQIVDTVTSRTFEGW